MAADENKRESLAGYPGSSLLRVLDSDWSEYTTAAGRKIYHNTKTDKTTWKPPRKAKSMDEKDQKRSSTWSLPATEDSVGVILKEGVMHIAKLWQDNIMLKKKWHKYDVVLTDSFFVFVRSKKSREDQIRRVSLSSATLRKETKMTKKKNATCLTSKAATMLLYCKDSVEAEAWFIAITTVIHNLCKPRPMSLNLNYSNNMFNFGHMGIPRFSMPRNMYDNDNNNRLESMDVLTHLRSSRSYNDYLNNYHKPDMALNKRPLSLSNNWIDTKIDSVLSYRENEWYNPEKRSMSLSQLKNLFEELPPNFKYPTPPGWIARYDETFGRYVYSNLNTGEVWGVAKRENGGVYFFDTKSFATSLLLPSENSLRKSFRKETII